MPEVILVGVGFDNPQPARVISLAAPATPEKAKPAKKAKPLVVEAAGVDWSKPLVEAPAIELPPVDLEALRAELESCRATLGKSAGLILRSSLPLEATSRVSRASQELASLLALMA